MHALTARDACALSCSSCALQAFVVVLMALLQREFADGFSMIDTDQQRRQVATGYAEQRASHFTPPLCMQMTLEECWTTTERVESIAMWSAHRSTAQIAAIQCINLVSSWWAAGSEASRLR